jgi:hypothetical protein
MSDFHGKYDAFAVVYAAYDPIIPYTIPPIAE